MEFSNNVLYFSIDLIILSASKKGKKFRDYSFSRRVSLKLVFFCYKYYMILIMYLSRRCIQKGDLTVVFSNLLLFLSLKTSTLGTILTIHTFLNIFEGYV